MDTRKIKEHMPIVGSDNKQLGKVDHLQGDNCIKVAKDDKGQHHYIPTSWVKTVDDKIHLDRPCNQAMSAWSERASLV